MSPGHRTRGPLFQVLAVGVVLILLALVLAPSSATANSPVVALVHALRRAGAPAWAADPEFWGYVFNVILFVPVGVLGALLLPRWSLGRWLLVGLLVSTAIELAQGFLLPARDADALDVLTNTLGTVIGAWLTQQYRARRRATGR